ncbi:MAG: hypothetical protein AAFZ02_01115 [Pseudomonadota bacterium]
MRACFATLALCLSLICAAAPAAAQDSIEAQVIRQLEAAGYSEIVVSRTLLGRLRFEALSETRRREVIVHPTSGAVLFDDVTPARGGARTVTLPGGDDDGGAGPSSGRDNDDDDDDANDDSGDEGDDDDDDDDGGDDDDGDDDDDDD